MPKRRRSLPSGLYWRGDTIYGRAQVAGRDYRFSLHTGDIATAKARLAVERKRLTAEARYGEHDRRWEDVVVAWAGHIAGTVGQRTAARYAMSLDQIRPWLTGRRLGEIDRRLVGDLVDGRRRQKATAATVRRDLTALSSVWSYAAARGWVDENRANPALTWHRMTRERRDPIVLPDEASLAAVLAAASPAMAALIRAARATGARQDELVRADRRDLDAARRTLTLHGKGGRVRTIDVSEAWGVFAALPAGIAAAALFTATEGGRWTNVASRFAGLTRRVAAEQKKAGQPFHRFRFHDLRHLHAVEFLRAGGSKDALQVRLGHASVATTELYCRYITAEEKQAAGTKTGTEVISAAGSNGRK